MDTLPDTRHARRQRQGAFSQDLHTNGSFGKMVKTPGKEPVSTVPLLNITDNKINFIVNVAVPGFKKEHFKIHFENYELTISCDQNTEPAGPDADDYTLREFDYTAFSRSVTLPDSADNKGIVARYTDGILCITIPKKTKSHNLNAQEISVQ